MWPRWIEMLLGIWLLLSPRVLMGPGDSPPAVTREQILGLAVVSLSALSFTRRAAWAHWLTGVAALVLGAVPYFTLQRPGPPAAQNAIVVAFTLLMLFLLPNHVSRPPRQWERLWKRPVPGPGPAAEQS